MGLREINLVWEITENVKHSRGPTSRDGVLKTQRRMEYVVRSCIKSRSREYQVAIFNKK